MSTFPDQRCPRAKEALHRVTVADHPAGWRTKASWKHTILAGDENFRELAFIENCSASLPHHILPPPQKQYLQLRHVASQTLSRSVAFVGGLTVTPPRIPPCTTTAGLPLASKQSGGGSEREEIKADLLVWTAGSQPSSLVDSLDVQKDSRGRIEVDRRLRLVGAAAAAADGASVGGGGGMAGRDDVYCLGDIVAVEGLDLGCNAQVCVFSLNCHCQR